MINSVELDSMVSGHVCSKKDGKCVDCDRIIFGGYKRWTFSETMDFLGFDGLSPSGLSSIRCVYRAELILGR